MKTYKNQVFTDLIDQDSFELFQNILFEKCEFKNCKLSQTENPENRSTVRNVEIEDCTMSNNCDTGCAIFENIEVDNLEIKGLLQFYGAVFKHIYFRGEVGKIFISNEIESSRADTIKESFASLNTKYYETVDWALDISRANFSDLEIWGIPSRLIIYDYKSQRIITREKAAAIKWDILDLKSDKFKSAVEKMLNADYEDIVLVAPRSGDDFEDLLHDLDLLTDAGYTEPEERMSND